MKTKNKLSKIDKLKLKVDRYYSEENLNIFKDLFSQLRNTYPDNNIKMEHVDHDLFNICLFIYDRNHYYNKVDCFNLEDLKDYLFTPNLNNYYRYKQFGFKELRIGFAIEITDNTLSDKNLKAYKNSFELLFRKSKLRKTHILQIKTIAHFLVIEIIPFIKSFRLQQENRLLINMKNKIDINNGAIRMLKELKEKGSLQVGTIFQYNLDRENLSDNDINLRINSLVEENNKLYFRVNKMNLHSNW